MEQNKYITFTLNVINELLQKKDNIIIAVDGRCASGKTTFADELKKNLPCTVLHMDDFFLRSHQRTKERLSLPGENVDHERFLEQVLLPLSRNELFAYNAFDCKTQNFKDSVDITPTAVTVVEGAYSCHPELVGFYDLTVFIDVEKDVQLERILKRNGKEKLKIFKEHWIVFEERYFEAFDIPSKCDIYIKEFNLKTV